jgi:hypothetical protein
MQRFNTRPLSKPGRTVRHDLNGRAWSQEIPEPQFGVVDTTRKVTGSIGLLKSVHDSEKAAQKASKAIKFSRVVQLRGPRVPGDHLSILTDIEPMAGQQNFSFGANPFHK